MIVLLIVLLAAGWVVMLVTAPILPIPLAGALYAIGSGICHQRPDRSFHLFAAQLVVCARCTGIYAGASVGSAAALSARLRALATPTSTRMLLLLGAAPTAVTWVLEWIGAWSGSNVGRAAAGLPLGAVVGVVVVQAVATLHYGGCPPRPPIASNRPSTPT